jgi:hypothetical protein
MRFTFIYCRERTVLHRTGRERGRERERERERERKRERESGKFLQRALFEHGPYRFLHGVGQRFFFRRNFLPPVSG